MLSRPARPSRRRGFTLIEMLIALVVMGVMVALALPSFMGSVRKSRRAEAFGALSAVQLAQERWRANNPTYSSLLSNLNVPATTASGRYGIALTGTTGTAYTAVATANSGNSQVEDGDCAKLSVRINAGNIFYGSAPVSGTLVDSASGNACWSR